MTLSINTNIAATRASKYLASNHQNLQKSLDRLSSGKRITQPSDDAGGLAVSMKLEHSINGLKGASSNISNGISMLQVQDGILDSAADIVSRMGELKSMHSDVTKNTSDKATYDAEFKDLQTQLWNLGQTKFNGIRVFGDYDETDTKRTANNVFGTNDGDTQVNLSVYTTDSGSSGSSVDVAQTLFLSALTLAQANLGAAITDFTIAAWDETNAAKDDTDGAVENGTFTLAVETAANRFSLEDVSSLFFTKALQNLATARASNGGTAKRLDYAQANVETQITNLTAANGRIMDVDIATESAALARHQILVQASASMVAQANSANNVALQLLQ